ncbi:MAG: ATP-binding protein [Chitinophagaceae bacterium]
MHRILPLFYFAVIFSFQAVSVNGQNSYIIQHYTNENGLPANGVKGIELDKKNGFLWIGTQAGLVRFDGKNFKNVTSKNKLAADSRIHFIAKNREGNLYLEDDNFSVYQIVRNQPEFMMTDSFLIDPFLLRGGSVNSLQGYQVAEKLRHHPRSSFLPPWMVFHDETGDSSSFTFIYFGYAYHYNAARDTLLHFTENLNFQQIIKLDGRVYFVRENLDVWTYNDSLMKLSLVPVKGLPAWDKKENNTPLFIWKPGMQEPLLIYKEDIWTLQRKDDSLYLQPFCHACSPPNTHIIAAQIWKEQGVIFLGSDVEGLFVVRSQFLHTVQSDAATGAEKAEYAQAETSPDVVTTARGLSFSSQGKLLPLKTPMPSYPFTIYQNQQGDRWFHVKDTIIHFHQKDKRYTKIAVNDNAVKMVFVEAGNRMYVVSDIAIAEITEDRYRPLYKLPVSGDRALKNSLNPDAVIEWKPGVLAIAAENLLLFDIGKKEAPDTIPVPGLTAKVRTLQKCGDYLLIGTYGQGFYLYRDGIVKRMPLDKSRYLSYTHCFMPDDKGYCWISTNHGLFKVSLNALMKAYENNLTEIYYQYFGKDDGIFNTEFNGGCQPCALKLSSGLFSFPSMNGVVIFNPSRQHTPPFGGQVFIDEILADSTLYQANDSSLYALPYQLKNLRFKLALPQFGNTENIYFSYKLEPYSSEWETQDIAQNNMLLFGGLKPGNYQLYLRVRNGFEPDQFSTTVIAFHILKPWYQTWWFYLLCLLGFIAMTWGLVRWRTARIAKRKEELQQQVAMQTKSIEEQSKQLESQLGQLQSQQERLEEDNQIKARLIGVISHDMISPLKFMGYMSKRMKETLPESDAHHRTAGFIANVAQELESLSVNILNWIKFHHGSVKMKAEKFDLHEVVTESVKIASTLAREKGVLFSNNISVNTEVFQYRQAVGVIIYNLAMNAVKYTSAGQISINSQSTDHHLTLSISDTGMGMPPELIKKLNTAEFFVAGYSIGETSKYQFGYVIIKDLLRLADGNMKVESVLNEGTRVTIRFKQVARPGG